MPGAVEISTNVIPVNELGASITSNVLFQFYIKHIVQVIIILQAKENGL